MLTWQLHQQPDFRLIRHVWARARARARWSLFMLIHVDDYTGAGLVLVTILDMAHLALSRSPLDRSHTVIYTV